MPIKPTGAEIRKSFIDFFVERDHTFVPSSSLVPGGDSTLLFTNAGMVQFKDVFLGTDQRSYSRAVNSQKCLRVSGKHNDLEEVGRDDTHHTFFEMLGNWSFGDYYKKEAITWAWQLLTEVWKIPKEKLWATYFKDELDEIPEDLEAAEIWLKQPGFNPEHLLPFGREENFWEMAETGPCGPDTEIHIDRGLEFCTLRDDPNHICGVNGDCERFLELWNNVFIQYNRISPTELIPLEKTHVDTGMGFERIVSILQNAPSNYKTDLFLPLITCIQNLAGQTDEERETNLTPYRVIADHARSTTFLIADGVVPGNIGRNYICRMLVRRAARFGMKLGLTEPFLAKVSQVVIDEYGDFFPELKRNALTILENLTREEKRFAKTVHLGLEHLNELLSNLKSSGGHILSGEKAFDLYATMGLPLEITRDIAQEQGLDVDASGYEKAMEKHRLISGAAKAFSEATSNETEIYASTIEKLVNNGKLNRFGVIYDPYHFNENPQEILALFKDGQSVDCVHSGDVVEVLLPETAFYVESGGQVSDTGQIISFNGEKWSINITGMRKPAAGAIVHVGEVISGSPHVGDSALAQVDLVRRVRIMRNHTATHLLHSALHEILGNHARQAGSLVAPDHLRFDFTHHGPMSSQEILAVEALVNQAILANYRLEIDQKSLDQAIDEGAIALFGEKYESIVRTVQIGGQDHLSYELCGGTHVDSTGDIGLFLITSETSIAAGVRRIEAVTGWQAYQHARNRMNVLDEINFHLGTSTSETPSKIKNLQDTINHLEKENEKLRHQLVGNAFDETLDHLENIEGIPVIKAILPNADMDTLREMADKFRDKHTHGMAILASIQNEKPILVATVTDDLVKRGFHAGHLAQKVAKVIGGSGGGRPNLAQAGGKDPVKLAEALDQVQVYIRETIQ